MPDYEFTMPDGVKVIITSDTDPTPEVVKTVTQQYYAQKPKVGLGDVRSAERRAPAVPPSQKQIQDYRKWFKDEASGSMPYKVLQDYLLSSNQKNFQFPRGFSEVGKAAIRAEAQSRLAAQRESEKQYSKRAIAESKRLGATGTEWGESVAATNALMMALPDISRRMTAAVTGQEASQALPLGLYPRGKLTPARGFAGTMQRAAGELLTPEGIALAATAPLAAPILEAYPVLGLAAAGTSALTGLVGAGKAASTGDYGKAVAEAILGGAGAIVPGALGKRALGKVAPKASPMPALHGTSIPEALPVPQTSPMPTRPGPVISESLPVPQASPMPTRQGPIIPEALLVPPARLPIPIKALPMGPTAAEQAAGLGLPALPAPPTAIPLGIGPKAAARQARIESAVARAGEVNVIPPSGEAPIQLGGPANAPLLTQAEAAARRASGFKSPPPLKSARVRGLERAYYEIGAGPELFANETHREVTTRLRALLDEAAPYMRRGEKIPGALSALINAMNKAALQAASGDEVGARVMLGQQAQSRLNQISAQLAATRRLAESPNINSARKDKLKLVIKALDKEAQGINEFLASQPEAPTAPMPIPQPVRTPRKKKPSELIPEEAPAAATAVEAPAVPVTEPPVPITEPPVAPTPEPPVTIPISGPYSMVPKQPVEQIVPTPESIVPPSMPRESVAVPTETTPTATPAIPPTPEPRVSVGARARVIREPLNPEQQTIAKDIADEIANIVGFERWNQINRRSTIEREAERAGIPGAVPPRGVNQPGLRQFKEEVDRVVSDPEYRASVLADIADFNPNNPDDIAAMTTARQTAASYRRRELSDAIQNIEDLDTPEGRAVLSEYQRLSALTTKVGSRKGWDLAMQNLFAGPLDFRKADSVDRAIDLASTALRSAGATDAQIARVVDKARKMSSKGQGRFSEISSRIDKEALAAETARRGAVPPRRTTMQRQAKEVSEEPLLPEGVQLIKDGIKELDKFKQAIIKKVGGQIPDDRIEALFRDSLRKYAADSSDIDAIKSEFIKAVNKETWDSYSAGQKMLIGMRNIQNIHRALVLNLDMGVYGIQLGMAAATRPSLGFVPPQQASSTAGAKRLLTSIFGGSPEKGAGYIPASLRVLKAKTPEEVAARVAEVDSELDAVQRIRYPDIENPYATAGLFGFEPQDINTGVLTESMLGRNIVEQVLGGAGKIYSKFDDANQAALRYGRATLFEQLMQPFDKYQGEEKLAAMRAVANFTNTLTGGPRYQGGMEAVIRGLSSVFVSPRFAMSQFEMANVAQPMIRSLTAAKQGIGPDGKPIKLTSDMVTDISKMVLGEYGRMISMLGTAKLMLAPFGIEVGLDPRDRNSFGKAVVPVGEGMEETIDLTGKRGEYMAVLTEIITKMRPSEGTSKPWTVVDPLKTAGYFALQKTNVVPQMIFSKGTFTPEKLAGGPSFGSLYGGQYSLPGGKTWTPSDAMSMMVNLGDVLIPMPVIAKQIGQLGRTGAMLNSGSIESDRKQSNVLLGLSGLNLAAGFFGAPLSVRPNRKSRIASSALFKEVGAAITPAQREAVRLKVMTRSK